MLKKTIVHLCETHRRYRVDKDAVWHAVGAGKLRAKLPIEVQPANCDICSSLALPVQKKEVPHKGD